MGKWIGLRGESFANDDGSNRQDEIARCSTGEAVTLRHDPDNRYDPNCVQVLSARGIQIGVLSKEHAAVFAPHLRAGHSIDAEIVKINGGSADKPSRGVVIEADVDEADFEDALEHVQQHGLAGVRFHGAAETTSEGFPITWALGVIGLAVVIAILVF